MITLPFVYPSWIEKEKLRFPTNDSASDFVLHGCTIAQCIPPLFESYCKLLHPFEIDPEEPDTLVPNKTYGQPASLTFSKVSTGEIKITETKADGTYVDLHKAFEEQRAAYKAKHWEQVTWESLAIKYGLRFHNEINTNTFANSFQVVGWQKNLRFPNEGYLPRRLLIQLLDILQTSSMTTAVCIYQVPPHNIFKNNKTFDLVQCSYNEVLEYFNEDFIGYLFAIDRSWIVFTDTDLQFTIIGGQKELIKALEDSEMEVVVCEATTRVDDYSDRINQT